MVIVNSSNKTLEDPRQWFSAGADLTPGDNWPHLEAFLVVTIGYSDLPVIVSNAYGEDGKLMTGASPAAMVAP